MDNLKLTEDILKEIFNVSVGKAADMLSDIILKKIVLNVPYLELIGAEDKELALNRFLPKTVDETLMVSSISFEKSLTGKANLIFPVDKMRTFINLCLHEDTDIYQLNFTDVDFDIIKEVGNIILNCVVGEVGNFLEMDFNYILPEVNVYKKADFTKNIENNKDLHILLLYITFLVDETEIEGAVIIHLTLNSLNELLKKITMIEAGLYE